MRYKWTHRGHQMVHPNNQVASYMWVPLHAIQETNETHEKSLVQDRVTCLNMFPFKKGDIKNLSAVVIIVFFFKPRLQQSNNHVWILCTSTNSHHQQHEAENSGRNFTMLIKRIGWILLHFTCYWYTNSFVHMNIVTNQRTSNTKVRRTDHELKPTRYYQGVSIFWMKPHNSNHIQRLQWTHAF